jgi:hypothetical protein
MRSTTRAASWLLFGGVLLAFVRIGWRTHGFATPGAQALTDLVGCVMTAGALYGVVAMRTLAAGAGREQVLDDGVSALALGAWLLAVLPPRAENFREAQPADDFIFAYVPAVLLAVTVLLVLAEQGPKVTTPWGLGLRHALFLAGVVPLTGGLVVAVVHGDGAGEVLGRSLLVGAACLLTAGVLAFLRQRSPGQ